MDPFRIGTCGDFAKAVQRLVNNRVVPSLPQVSGSWLNAELEHAEQRSAAPVRRSQRGPGSNRWNRSALRFVQLEVTVEETPDEYAWMFHARCRGVDPAEFFPSDGTGVEVAQRVCAECSVRVECLEYALLHRIEHGVWGGASERERRRILRRRRDLAPSSDLIETRQF
jgi:WhiB family redox-sensing transcriptional regulator